MLAAGQPGAPYGPPAPAVSPSIKAPQPAEDSCASDDPDEIVVCAQKQEGYRIDPAIMEAKGRVERIRRSTTAAVPLAQASCSASPGGCGTDLKGVDLLNVA